MRLDAIKFVVMVKEEGDIWLFASSADRAFDFHLRLIISCWMVADYPLCELFFLFASSLLRSFRSCFPEIFVASFILPRQKLARQCRMISPPINLPSFSYTSKDHLSLAPWPLNESLTDSSKYTCPSC